MRYFVHKCAPQEKILDFYTKKSLEGGFPESGGDQKTINFENLNFSERKHRGDAPSPIHVK